MPIFLYALNSVPFSVSFQDWKIHLMVMLFFYALNLSLLQPSFEMECLSLGMDPIQNQNRLLRMREYTEPAPFHLSFESSAILFIFSGLDLYGLCLVRPLPGCALNLSPLQLSFRVVLLSRAILLSDSYTIDS